jgi:hypothetical protein
MNEMAGTTGIRLADLDYGNEAEADEAPRQEGPAMHVPSHPFPEVTQEMDEDEDVHEDVARFEEELLAEEEQQAVFETDSSGSSKPNDNIRPAPLGIPSEKMQGCKGMTRTMSGT